MGALTPQTRASDVLVIGGGPAGCSAAIRLARSGASVALLERDRAATPKVCGEFLSVEACSEARALGVDPLELGAAPIDHVRVTWRGTTVETRLPFRAASLSRATFDDALMLAAQRAGATLHLNTRALSLEDHRITARNEHEVRHFEAPSLVLATGKSEFAGLRRSGGHVPDALGFKMHLALPERDLSALGSAVELTLFPGGYYGMQRIENTHTAFALVITRRAYNEHGTWPALIAYLRATADRKLQRLTNARELWPKPLAVSGVPYGFTHHDTPTDPPNLYRIGDQLAVIPSFTGDGMAIALVTGSSAAKAIAENASPQTFHAAMRKRLQTPMTVAGILSRAIASPIGRAAVIWPASIFPPIFSVAANLTRIRST